MLFELFIVCCLATQHALQHQINTLQQQIQQQQFMQQQQQQQQRPVNTTIQQILSGNYPRYHGGQPQHQQLQQQPNMNGRSEFFLYQFSLKKNIAF